LSGSSWNSLWRRAAFAFARRIKYHQRPFEMLNKFSALKHTGALFGNVNSAELRSAWCPGYLI
jgi:hypothetical protein